MSDGSMSDGRTAVVTGAAGYVGVNLVEALRSAGWSVRTFDLLPLAGIEPHGIDHTVGDVRDPAAMRAAFEGADVVFHLAARITLSSVDPEAWDVNVNGPSTAASAALDAGVARFVHCSSVHAFDLSLAHPRLDELSPRSVAPGRPVYDRSKAAGEEQVRKVIERGLDATIVNPTGVIGPVDHGPSRMNQVLHSAARGRLPVVVHGGFDWVDVRDVALGLVAAAEHGRTGENYLLPGHQASAKHVARLAAALNGHLGPVVAIPGKVATWMAPSGERIGRRLGSDAFTPASIGTLVEHPVVDGAKAARELGHAPRRLEDTVADFVRYYEGEPRL
jgi:dihydroflavonol-4-reductase